MDLLLLQVALQQAVLELGGQRDSPADLVVDRCLGDRETQALLAGDAVEGLDITEGGAGTDFDVSHGNLSRPASTPTSQGVGPTAAATGQTN